MSKISIEGNSSGTGTFTIASPNTNTSYSLSLPEEAGTDNPVELPEQIAEVVGQVAEHLVLEFRVVVVPLVVM